MTRASRILIVEDNALNLELASEVLRAHGHAVLQARTAALKEDARTSAIPTVALTAQAMTGDEAEARVAGFDAYVTKPIDTRMLPRLVSLLVAPGERT